MNITFILGNGFDIGLGMKTSYSDFYEEYSTIKTADNANIISFKDTLSNWHKDNSSEVIDWADFEKAFGQHAASFTLVEKDEYIERFEDFVSNFNSYLEAEEKSVDFSQTDLISQTMKNAVTTYYHIRNEDKDAIQRIYNITAGTRTYNFVSFNYTQSVDRCAQVLKQYLRPDNQRDVGKVIHIHGFIEENMIMGVNDASQIANPDFANDPEILQEIVKPNQNTNVRANYEKQFIEVINTSNIICIYGMSIGETDKKWWNTISKWLANDGNHALVILKYDKEYNKRFPFKQIKFINNVVENFLKLSGQSDEVKKIIRPRIYVGMNHNVMEMKLRKTDKEKFSTILELAEASLK